MAKTIILLEYQNDFLDKAGKWYSLIQSDNNELFLKKSAQLLNLARQHCLDIIHVPLVCNHDAHASYGVLDTVFQSGAFKRGTWGQAFIEQMGPIGNEHVLQGKSGLSAFSGTDLEAILNKKESRSIMVAGLLTNICIESTIRDAYDRGFDVTAIEDCMHGTTNEAHCYATQSTLPSFAKIMSLETVSLSLVTEMTNVSH